MGKVDQKANIKIKASDKEDTKQHNDRQRFRGKTVISKKEKHNVKRSILMKKFTILKKQQKEERDRKNREKTAVIGDLKPLKDALPSLDEVLKLAMGKDLKSGIHSGGLGDTAKMEERLSQKNKIRRKKDKFIRQVNSFQKLLKDPDFKKNPRDAIRYHIKYTFGGAMAE